MVDLTKLPGWERGFDPLNATEEFIARNSTMGSGNPKADFIEYMNSLGFRFDATRHLPIGEIVRMPSPTDTRPNQKTGWAVYHEVPNRSGDGNFGVGRVGCHRTNAQHSWTSKSYNLMTPAEQKDVGQRQEAIRIQHEMVKRQRYDEVSREAKNIWETIATDEGVQSHPYVEAKKITSYIAKRYNECLFIPAVDANHKMTTYQLIYPDGTKKWKWGGKKEGSYCYMQGDDSVVFITEGWATACSVHEATQHYVYVCFDTGNMNNVATIVKSLHPEARIVIAADDDQKTEGKSGENPGHKAATQAAILINCEIISPDTPSAKRGLENYDFNDMAQDVGVDELAAYITECLENLTAQPAINTLSIQSAYPDAPGGVLESIVNYYQATAPKPQAIIAMQTAIAVCSAAIGRAYRTDQDNFSALFMGCVAPSAFGKGHAKKVAEKLFDEWEMSTCMGGGDHNSAGSVNTLIKNKPRSLAVADEFGQYLTGTKTINSGQQQGAIKHLMEVITNCDTKYRGPNYSQGAAAGQGDDPSQEAVLYPSLSLLAITANHQFFNAVGEWDVHNGLLNRFIFAVLDNDDRPAKTPREQRELRSYRIDVPDSIIQWGRHIQNRTGYQVHRYNVEPNIIELPFFSNCKDLLFDLEEYEEVRAEELEEIHLAPMARRVREMSMRLSLIVALSEDAEAQFVDYKHLKWASDYVKYHHEKFCVALKDNIANTSYSAMRKAFYRSIKDAGKNGRATQYINSQSPFTDVNLKTRNEILADLIGAGEVVKKKRNQKQQGGKVGRPREVYIATENL